MAQTYGPNKVPNKVVVVLAILISIIVTSAAGYGIYFINGEKETIQKQIDTQKPALEKIKAEIENQKNELNTVTVKKEEKRDVNQMINNLKAEFVTDMQTLEQQIYDGKNETKLAYLTFDRAPNQYTEPILELLEEKNIYATFFIEVNKNYYQDGWDRIEKDFSPEYQKMVKNLHTIGIMIKNDDDDFYSITDVNNSKDIIKQNFGYDVNIVRIKNRGSNMDDEEFLSELKRDGYTYIDWNSSVRYDGNGELEEMSSKQMVANVVDSTDDRKFLVISMNEKYENSFKALPTIIDELTKQGYHFFPLFKESKAFESANIKMKNNDEDED